MSTRTNKTQAPLEVFLSGSGNQSLAGSYASGTVTVLAVASLTDGQTLTLDDGVNTAVVFEFDVAGDGVSGSNTAIDVSGDTSADDVGTTAEGVINGVSALNLTATNAAGVLTIVNTVKGEAGNVTTWASSNATINGNIVQPTGGERDLEAAGDSLNIADGQLAVISEDSNGTVPAGDFLHEGVTASQVNAVRVLQGTPFSTQLSKVSPFGYTHKAVVKSGILRKDKVRSISTRVFQLPRYDIVYITGVSGLTTSTRYRLNITMESPRSDVTYGMNRELLEATVTTPAAAPTDITDYVLQNLALKINRDYSKFVSNGHSDQFGGQKPVIAFGVDTAAGSGTVIGTMTKNTAAFNFAKYTQGSTTIQATYKPDIEMINSLNTAIGSVAALSTDTLVNLGSVAPGTASTIDGLLIVAFREDPLPVFDDVPELCNHIQVGFGLDVVGGTQPTHTNTKVCKAFEGANTGRQVLLRYRDIARQVAFSLQNHVSKGEYPLLPPEYVTETGRYTVSVIEFEDELTVSGGNHHQFVKQAMVTLPAAIASETVDADTGFTIATSATTTVTELNAVLGPWLASSSGVQYKESATSAAPFV